MRGKKTPDTKRAQAVGLALVVGTDEAAKKLGVSQRSVQRWVDAPEMAQLVAQKKGAVADQFWAAVQIGLESVVHGLREDAPLAARATAMGILFDKWALLSGEATERTEVTSTVLQGKSDHEQRLLADILNAELERRADADAHGAQEPDPVAQPATGEANTATG